MEPSPEQINWLLSLPIEFVSALNAIPSARQALLGILQQLHAEELQGATRLFRDGTESIKPSSDEGLRSIRAFTRIVDPMIRRALVDLTERLAQPS